MDTEKQKKLQAIWGDTAPINRSVGKTRADELRERAKLNRKEVRKESRLVGEKILDFTGGKEIAQGLGQAMAQGKTSKSLNQAQSMATDIQGQLLKRIKEKKSLGQDTSVLEGELAKIGINISQIGGQTEQMLNPENLTNKQVVGDALQLGTTVGTIGGLSGAGTSRTLLGRNVPGLTTQGQGIAENLAGKVTGGGTGVLRGAGQGALAGAGQGAVSGGLMGVGQGLQDDLSGGDIAKRGVTGALAGGLTGGVLGGVIGGVSGGLSGRKLGQEIIKTQEQSGLRPSLSNTIKEKTKTNKEFASIIKEAQKQGYNENEINLLASLSNADKKVAKKMYDVTIKSQSDPRQITRAADILGENASSIVRQVQSQNSSAGKLVDQTAKALKGQSFDALPIEQKVISYLDDAGVSIMGDGNIDFSQSIFKNTPKLQKEIQRVIRNIPDGSDAYQAHIFKKSVDELVNYGSGGEGLSGRASSLLKGFRTAVDDVLDTNFPDYNAANTEFKLTRDFIENVQNVVGKKVDFSTKAGSQAFGQSFRSAFSNNKSRGQTLALIEELQNIAKQRKLKGAEQNLLDQALYVNILEDTFGSQAATGLASEVSKGVKKAKGVVEGIRNPVSGILNATADAIEKAQNITPEAKKQILRSFID